MNVDVVNPNNLSPVNVDNLLVEQIAFQQQHAFPTAVRTPFCGMGRNPELIVNQADGLGGNQAIAVACLDNETADLARTLLRGNGDFKHFAGV